MSQFISQSKDTKKNHLNLALYALLLLALFLSPRLILGQTTTTYYDVGGNDLSEVSANIFGPNGVGPGGRAGSASLSYTRNPGFTCHPHDGQCVVTITPGSVTTNLECTILLPNWTGYNQASSEDQQEWNDFVAALTTHEQGHCDRYLIQANRDAVQAAAAAALEGQTFTVNVPCPNPDDCTNPNQELKDAIGAAVDNLLNNNQAFQDVLNQMEQVQQQFDSDTNNGPTLHIRVP